ncbi:MAG: DNA replication terminus site-binding protein [Oceanospirillaceae bacterium]|nr:DNA replication terminus site-binding protein [Oceanospirillaceae bacterium]MBT11039.1 DNA replication terminus site-binding protein [Oceanospirillaceae bacterium]|tara:strand:- start:223877 stop:224734 length:858 start_codon:yes stop_codon:yes gene_type:complete
MITELTSAFDDMMTALQALRYAITEQQPAHWLPLTPQEQASGARPLAVLTDLITDVWYRDGQDGRETRSRHGLIMMNDELRTLAQSANARKDAFHQIVRSAQQALEKPGLDELIAGLGNRHSDLRESLHFAGLSRVHLKQCYRHLPVLEHCPLKVGFSWYTNGRSIRKISVTEAQNKLLELGEEKSHIQIQLSKLNHLPPGQQLAQVQTLAPVVRANLVYPESAPRPRQAMNVALPLMLPGDILPEFNRLDTQPPEGRTRQRRGDQKVSDEPWLPSIRVHLYDNR